LAGGTQSLQLPNVPVSTSAVGLSALAGSVGEQFSTETKAIQDQQAKLLEVQKTSRESEEQRVGLIQRALGAITGRGEAERQAGIPELSQTLGEARKQVTPAFNALLASQRSQQAELKGLEGQGLTPTQIQQQSQAINRRYAFEQADHSFNLLVARQGVEGATIDLQTAQSIVDRKIALELEPIQFALDYTKEFVDRNRQVLDKEEERLFKLRTSQLENDWSERKDLATVKGNLALEFMKNGQTIPAHYQQRLNNTTTREEFNKVLNEMAKNGISLQNPLDRQIKQAQLAKYQIDAASALAKLGEAPKGTGVVTQAQAKGNIDLISELANDRNLKGAVGPTSLTRIAPIGIFTGGKSNFIAGVEQLRSQLSLDALILAKSKGATFGALSDTEMRILSASASKLGTWAISDKGGNVVGYRTNETAFRKEIDKINNFAKLDYLIKGGSPEDVGAQQLEDGTIWVANSDGSFTQIYP
jgi:hypothetical protein